MDIRLAVEDDFQLIMDFIQYYPVEHIQSYESKLDITRLSYAVKQLIKLKGVFLAYENEIIGVMAGMIVPSIFSIEQIFNMLFFVVKPEARKYTARIIKKIESELWKQGAHKIVISNFGVNNAEKMERFYKIMGYKVLETHYYKTSGDNHVES